MCEEKYVCIEIAEVNYKLSIKLRFNDIRVCIDELHNTHDSKRALSVMIYEQIKRLNSASSIKLEDIILENDCSFNQYITAMISNAPELKKVYDSIEKSDSLIDNFTLVLHKFITSQLNEIGQVFNNLVSTLKKNISDSMCNIENLIQQISPVNTTYNIAFQSCMKKFQENLSASLSKLQFPSLPEEQKEKLISNSTKWGNWGWTMMLESPINLFSNDPINYQNAYEIASNYCKREDMDDLFKKLHLQQINKKDLSEVIFCFRQKNIKLV